jgi:alpha-N-arabinofuranosidase
MDGTWQMGHMSAESYAAKAREAAKLMIRTSPGIKLIAAGSANYRNGADPDHWNQTVLEQLKDVIDYIGLHIYVGNPDNQYYNYISTPLIMEQRTQVVKGMIERVMQTAEREDRPPISIAWDEYNVCYREVTGLEETYNLEDALVIAGFLNAFVRNADVIKMANLAQLVNVIAPVMTNPTGLFKQTIFYPLQLFANNMRGTALDVFVDCEKYSTGKFYNSKDRFPSQLKEVPYLDVSAVCSDNSLTICVVNRHKDLPVSTELISQNGPFTGNFQVFEINGPGIKSGNNFLKTEVTTKEKPSVVPNGNVITYTFPAHSLTMMKGKRNTNNE